MVLFSTKFYVKPEFDRSILLCFLKKWLSSKQTYQFSETDLNQISELEYNHELVLESENQTLIIHDEPSVLAIQLKSDSDFDVYTNDYVLRDSILAVQLSKDCKDITIQRDKPYVNVPYLMRYIFWEEYGGMDANIVTDNNSYSLRKSDVDLVLDILLHRKEYINPIIYISAFSSGRYPLNSDMLAQDLAGIAHVLVEGSPLLSDIVMDKLQECISSDSDMQTFQQSLPKNGEIGIFMPDGVSMKLEHENVKILTQNVKNVLYRSVSMLQPDPNYSFSHIHQNSVLEKYKDNGELSELFDTIISEKDGELKDKNDKIAELEEKIRNLTTELMNLQSKEAVVAKKYLSTEDTDAVECVKLICGEQELYPGELNDVILKLIASALKSMEGDKTLRSSRKYHVLSNLKDLNLQTGQDMIISDVLDDTLKDGELNGDVVRQLSSYGFKVISGKKHNKIQFMDDERYQTIIANSVSDHRAGNNLASLFKNQLFGYY